MFINQIIITRWSDILQCARCKDTLRGVILYEGAHMNKRGMPKAICT